MTHRHQRLIPITAAIILLGSLSSALANEPSNDILVTPLDSDEPHEIAPDVNDEAHEDVALDEAHDEGARGAVDEADAQPIGFFADLSEEETQAYAEELRGYVTLIRGVALEKIAAKIEEKQGARLGQISMVLFGISLLGLLLLFMPLVLRRRFPGRGGLLLRYSALAALLFFLAVNLFSAVLMTMRGAQTVAGEYTNPQVRLVSATFDLFYKKADEIAPVGKTLIEPTLESLRTGGENPALVVLLENVQKLAGDISVFRSVASFFSRIDFLLGVLPLVLIGLAILFFFQAARPTLVAIIKIPERAASGEHGIGRQAVRSTLRAVWQETKATLCVIAVILAITLVSGLILSTVLMPVIEVFLAYLVASLMYVQAIEGASSFWVLFSLLASIAFLVLSLALIVVGSAFFLSKAQKIFQMKFRDGVPLRAHGHFWKWGTASLVWSQLLPLIYMKGFIIVIGWIVLKTMATENWALILGGGPLIFLLSFVVFFWAGRGFVALGFLARYKPNKIPRAPGTDAPMSTAKRPPHAQPPAEYDATIPVPRFDPSAVEYPTNAAPTVSGWAAPRPQPPQPPKSGWPFK